MLLAVQAAQGSEDAHALRQSAGRCRGAGRPRRHVCDLGTVEAPLASGVAHQVGGLVHVDKPRLVPLDDPRPQLAARAVEREIARLDPPLEDGECGATVGARKRPGLRNRRLGILWRHPPRRPEARSRRAACRSEGRPPCPPRRSEALRPRRRSTRGPRSRRRARGTEARAHRRPCRSQSPRRTPGSERGGPARRAARSRRGQGPWASRSACSPRRREARRLRLPGGEPCPRVEPEGLVADR